MNKKNNYPNTERCLYSVFVNDNLHVMRGIDQDSVDLIYLDPPFNSGKQWSNPIGKGKNASFKDVWTLNDIRMSEHAILKAKHKKTYAIIQSLHVVNGGSWNAYLTYMSVRLIEMYRILKPTGSIYYHCDSTMSHGIKLVMDSIFGRKNFRNEIIWVRGTASGGKAGGKKSVPNHDTIFHYVMNARDFVYYRQYTPYDEKYIKERFKHTDDTGRRYRLQLKNKKQYLDESKGKPVTDIWSDVFPVNPNSKEKTKFPTQKPEALLRRIIESSSNKGDLVLDPFCGCATTCHVAYDTERKWIGIDISLMAVELLEKRIGNNVKLRTDIPRLSNCPPPRKNIVDILHRYQNGYCNGCGTLYNKKQMTKDHIVPESKSGPNTDANLQLLCSRCNNLKKSKDMASLFSQLIEKGVLLREDIWDGALFPRQRKNKKYYISPEAQGDLGVIKSPLK